MRLLANFVFLIIFAGLFGFWLISWGLMHVASAAIHVLLLLAAFSFVLHLLLGRRTLDEG